MEWAEWWREAKEGLKLGIDDGILQGNRRLRAELKIGQRYG